MKNWWKNLNWLKFRLVYGETTKHRFPCLFIYVPIYSKYYSIAINKNISQQAYTNNEKSVPVDLTNYFLYNNRSYKSKRFYILNYRYILRFYIDTTNNKYELSSVENRKGNKQRFITSILCHRHMLLSFVYFFFFFFPVCNIWGTFSFFLLEILFYCSKSYFIKPRYILWI